MKSYELTSGGIKVQAQGWENPSPQFLKVGAKDVVTSDYGNRFLAPAIKDKNNCDSIRKQTFSFVQSVIYPT